MTNRALLNQCDRGMLLDDLSTLANLSRMCREEWDGVRYVVQQHALIVNTRKEKHIHKHQLYTRTRVACWGNAPD